MLICIPADCCKNHGCYCKIPKLQWTSSRRSICLHPGKIGGRSKIAQNSQIGVSTFSETPSTTEMAQIQIHWFLLNEICTDTYLLDCCGKDSSRKFCWNLGGEKNRIENVSLFTEKQGLWHLKNAELESKHQKYKGRVVLRDDFVKDDSGSYAVFTEQGSSAS